MMSKESQKELAVRLYNEAVNKVEYLKVLEQGMENADPILGKDDSENRALMSTFNTRQLVSAKFEEAYHQKHVAEIMLRDIYKDEIVKLEPKEEEFMSKLNEIREDMINGQV
jgi:hypothetical protein|nr:Hypothetical protein PLANC_85 [Enterococcus phage Planchet]